MAIKTKDELLNSIKEILGDNSTTDNAISLLEDLSDTYDSLQPKEDEEEKVDWEAKYNELDASWRKKYTDRFFQKNDDSEEQDDQQGGASRTQEEMRAEEVSFDDLFENK